MTPARLVAIALFLVPVACGPTTAAVPAEVATPLAATARRASGPSASEPPATDAQAVTDRFARVSTFQGEVHLTRVGGAIAVVVHASRDEGLVRTADVFLHAQDGWTMLAEGLTNGPGFSGCTVVGPSADAVDAYCEGLGYRTGAGIRFPITAGASYDFHSGAVYVGAVAVGRDVLALKHGTVPHIGPTLLSVRGTSTTTPVPARATPASCGHDHSWIHTVVQPSVLLATPSGTVMTLGNHCRDHAPAMEIWPAGASVGRIVRDVPLPQPERPDRAPRFTSFMGPGASEAWAVDGRLWRFDGESWAEVPGPSSGGSSLPVQAVAVQRDGTVWSLVHTPASELDVEAKRDWTVPLVLYERRSGRWSRHALPGGVAPQELSVDGRDRVWVAAGGDVFRRRVESEPIREMVPPTRMPALGTTTKPGPMHDGCAAPFVALFALTRSAPPDFDAPETRKALAGRPEASRIELRVVRMGNDTFVGATADSPATARSVADIVRLAVPRASPQLLCETPSVVRELRFDPRTGVASER